MNEQNSRFLTIKIQGVPYRIITQGPTPGLFVACKDLHDLALRAGGISRPTPDLVAKRVKQPKDDLFKRADFFPGWPKGFASREAMFLFADAWPEFLTLGGVDDHMSREICQMILVAADQAIVAGDELAAAVESVDQDLPDALLSRIVELETTVEELDLARVPELVASVQRLQRDFKEFVAKIDQSAAPAPDMARTVQDARREARREAAEEFRRSVGPAYGTAMKMIEGK